MTSDIVRYVFAYEKGKGSARNFSDWLVEKSRIEQPDSSCRGESVDVRNVSIRVLNI